MLFYPINIMVKIDMEFIFHGRCRYRGGDIGRYMVVPIVCADGSDLFQFEFHGRGALSMDKEETGICALGWVALDVKGVNGCHISFFYCSVCAKLSNPKLASIAIPSRACLTVRTYL